VPAATSDDLGFAAPGHLYVRFVPTLACRDPRGAESMPASPRSPDRTAYPRKPLPPEPGQARLRSPLSPFTDNADQLILPGCGPQPGAGVIGYGDESFPDRLFPLRAQARLTQRRRRTKPSARAPAPAAGCLDWKCVMIIILGLIVLIAAVVIGVAGVLGNGGSGHALTNAFTVFGYHVTGSTGTLFRYGIEVGVIALAGLRLLLAGARRTSRRSSAARRRLRQSRQETAAAVNRDRDDLHRPARRRPRIQGKHYGQRHAPQRPRSRPGRQPPRQAALVRVRARTPAGRRWTRGTTE